MSPCSFLCVFIFMAARHAIIIQLLHNAELIQNTNILLWVKTTAENLGCLNPGCRVALQLICSRMSTKSAKTKHLENDRNETVSTAVFQAFY